MNIESRTRFVALGLVAALGPIALLGACGEEENNSWVGCNQVRIQPGGGYIGPSVDKRLEAIDKDNGTHTEVAGGMHAMNKEVLQVMSGIYEQVYGKKDVDLQAGDLFPFCIDDHQQVSLNDEGVVRIRDKSQLYVNTRDGWQRKS